MTVTNRPRRANGNGSVYWVAARSRWARTVTLPNGQRRTNYFKTEAEAKRDLRDTLKKLDSGQIGVAKATLKTGDYLVGWLDNVIQVTQKPLTYQTYSYIVHGRLIPALGRVPLVKLAPAHVEQLQLAMLERGLSVNTIKSMRTCLGSALAHAVEQDLIPLNVVNKVKVPRLNNADDEDAQFEARVFDKDEIDRFLSAAAGDEFEPMFRFMLSTGLRPGEARGVRWQDIDFNQRVLHVRRQTVELKGGRRESGSPKSKKGRRQIPLLAPALVVLTAQQERVKFLSQRPGWQDQDLVFPAADGRPVVSRTVRDHMKHIVEQAGLGHATPHTLRHSAATFLLAAGVNQQVVMTYLGHASAGTTAMYQHVMPDMLHLAGEMLDEYFKTNGIMY
jgi:integrase